MIYFLPSIIAVFFSFFLSRTKGISWYIFFLLAVLLPSIPYGFRSVTVGVDALVYAEPIWDYAKNLQSFNFGSYWGKNIETGYLFINYILANHVSQIQWLFFTLAIFACFTVLKAIWSSDFKSETWLGYAFYLLIFFPESANAIRQGFASAFLIGASLAVFQKKWKTFFFYVLIASLFHNVALLALSYPCISYIFNKSNSKIRQYIWSIVLISCVFGGQVIFSQLAVINDKYSIYLDGTFDPHFTIFSLVNLPFIILFFAYYKPLKKLFSYHPIEVYMLIAGLVLSQLSWIVSVYLARVAAPFNLFLIFAPMILLKWIKQKNKKFKSITAFACIAYAIGYFWLVYYVCGIDSLFPYQSEFINFY